MRVFGDDFLQVFLASVRPARRDDRMRRRVGRMLQALGLTDELEVENGLSSGRPLTHARQCLPNACDIRVSARRRLHESPLVTAVDQTAARNAQADVQTDRAREGGRIARPRSRYRRAVS